MYSIKITNSLYSIKSLGKIYSIIVSSEYLPIHIHLPDHTYTDPGPHTVVSEDLTNPCYDGVKVRVQLLYLENKDCQTAALALLPHSGETCWGQ